MGTKQQIRVFLSSTFVDMQEERDYLVKKIFPSIKAECRRRGVDFVALDLRWGINEEAAKSGKVVEICMDEIVRSRPFFIGLLGGRYGWSPEVGDGAITERLLMKYPWIEGCVKKGMSITEMEMQFGVLSNPEKINAFFYQKNEVAVSRKFKEKRGSVAAQKLADLKAAVKDAADAGRCTLTSYSSLKTLGQEVYDSLMNAVNELYPQQVKSRYSVYSLRQNEFLESRRKVYVNYADAPEFEGKVLVVGPGGSGKSALVANHASGGMKGDSHLVYTVVNSDVNSSEMCIRMMLHELSLQVGTLDVNALDQPLDVPVDLKKVFQDAGFDGKVRWVIDGIDKLGLDNDKSATWLASLPVQISEIILTTSSVDSINSAILKDYEIKKVYGLKSGEILEITKKYLKGYSKSLSGAQESHISNSQLLQNPETLMVFLEELLQFGVYEKLGEFVENYLSVGTVEDFYLKVLERMDADFGFERMKDVFTYIILCGFGIAEEKLIDLLKVNNIEWVAIYTAILPFISVSGGYLTMDDANMCAAARRHYDISSAEQNRRLVKKVVRVVEDDNSKLKKLIRKRIIEENGIWEYMGGVVLDFFFGRYFAIPYGSSVQEEERFLKNRYSALGLYVNAGMLRKAMKQLVGGGFISLMTYSRNSFPLIQKILLHPRNHMSEMLTCGLAIISRFAAEFPIANMYCSVFNLYADQKRKEKEIRKWMRKMRLLPFSREHISQCKNFLTDGGSSESLENLLERDNLDEVMMDIIYKMAYPYVVESESELLRIAEKAASAVSRLAEDDIIRTICSLIASSCYMRLGDPKARDFMIQSVNDSINVSVFTHLYDIYELFEVSINNDVQAYERLYEKMLPYRNGEVGVDQRNVCYAVMLARPYFVIGEKHQTEVIINEYIESLRQIGSDVPESLYKMGMWFHNMKMHDLAYEVFIKAASEYEETKYSDRILTYRRAALSSKKKNLYAQAYECLCQALDIKKTHISETSEVPVWRIYDELEEACREMHNYAEAIAWAQLTIEELKREKIYNWLSEAYNVLSINASRLVGDKKLSAAERELYFKKAYDAACESEKWSEPDDSGTVVVNRAVTVFEAAGEIEAARLLVGQHVKILEKILAFPGNKGARVEYVYDTLAKGYLLIEDWAGLKTLQDKYDLRRPHIFKKQLHILYLGNADRAEALNDLVRVFSNEIFKGNGATTQSLHEEVAEMGISDLLIASLLENAEQDVVLMRLKRYYAVKSLADANGNKELSEKAMDLLCSVFLNEKSAFEFYEAFCWRTPLAERLKAQDVSEDFLTRRRISFLVSEIESSNVYGLVDDAVHCAMQTSSPMFDLSLVGEEVKRTWRTPYIKEYLVAVYQERELIRSLLAASDQELKDRFLDLLKELASWPLYENEKPDEDDINLGYDMLRCFSLPCNPYIVASKMIFKQEDEAEVIQLWNENPECQINPFCQAEYLKALEWQGRSEEVVSLAEGYLQKAGSKDEIMVIASRYIIALRNLGRYEESLSVLEQYAERCGEESFIYLKDILLAYTGRPAEALLLLERNWEHSFDNYFMKAVFLLRQGLMQDAEKAVEGLVPSLEERRDWVSVLYLIELARYWKNAGDVPKAKGYMKQAREFMSTSHLRMCEYEAAQLGLD